MLDALLAKIVDRKIVRQLPHPVRLAPGSQHRLPEAQIRHRLRQPETQLRQIQIHRVFGYLAIAVDGPLPHVGRNCRVFFIVEILHRAAQKSPLVVEAHHLEPAASARQNIQPPVGIFAKHLVHHRRASRIDDAFFARQNYAEFLALANRFADHLFVAILKNV